MQYKVNYTVFRDHDRAHEFCREFLDGSCGHVVDTYSHNNRDTDYIVIFDDELSANEPYYFDEKLAAMSRADLFYLWSLHHDDYFGSDELTESELIDALSKVTRRQYYAEHYEQNHPCEVIAFDFYATGYSQGDKIKVCNADDNPYITSEYISNLFFNAPIHASCEVHKRADSDSAWELVTEIYLDSYTDLYEPSYDEVYQCLLADRRPLAHLVAYDMPTDIFENV